MFGYDIFSGGNSNVQKSGMAARAGTYMYMCMYVYVHTYIHTFIHTYIHTYIQASVLEGS